MMSTVPPGKIKSTNFQEHLNSIEPCIKFTIELPGTDGLAFLDTLTKPQILGGGQLLAIELSTATRCPLPGGFQLPAVEPSTATRCHYQYQAEEAVILIGKPANCHSAQSSNWQSNPPQWDTFEPSIL